MYAEEPLFNWSETEEIQIQNELLRQRQYLERTIEGLKKTLKVLESKNESHYLIMDENMKLIKEINTLRKEGEMYYTKYNNLKTKLRVNNKL